MVASALPDGIRQGAFTVAEAKRLGVRRKRLRGGDLARPFHGVRTSDAAETLQSLAVAYAARMAPGHVFAGATAARLWGLPVRSAWTPDELLVIGVPAGRPRTRATGTRTRPFDPARMAPGSIEGLPVLGPISAVMTMARHARHADLVVLVDALITPSKRYPGLNLARCPFTTVADLDAFAQRCRGVHGRVAFEAAVRDARVGADSPQETRSRLTIVAAGRPEPVVQHEVWVDGAVGAVLDLAYPEWLIAIEYEGEHHLTDPAQWAKDIRRQELLESLGWIVIRVTKSDLRDGGAPLTRRVRAALARRGVVVV